MSDTTEDRTLERLLALDGEIMEVGGGFWVSIKAHRVEATAERPNGVDYSLCLFTPDKVRVICFDNAHQISVGSGPSKRRTATSDHVHRGKKVKPYNYSDAETLLVDFWDAVYKHLKEEGVP
jgi:aminoglycoside N3'-acetyltransferase